MTHHKSNFRKQDYIPLLALGVVVKGEKSSHYYLCIQQKCDSVRLEPSESRRFLFLRLECSDSKFNVILKDRDDKYIKLAINNKNCFEIRTIKFRPNNSDSVIKAKIIDGKYCFIPEYHQDTQDENKINEEKFEWILDLKEAHAQKISNDFAAKLARVGVDESEWLRRS